ncbi:hypothetical protein CVT24_008857 [Panaeolus cyanescens]|uniref:Enterotoxin n=1 Tax=Panaeolus cyanescens TaxID=181874 RepID=A0A409VAV0_9AGAR|nr:hypothetical protein CVT24_008857 [Panaeolus cyanescens]
MRKFTFQVAQYFLLIIFHLSAICAVHATPGPLRPAIRQGLQVYRAVTRGELPFINNYVVGQPPPLPLPIAGDFGRNGGIYVFTSFSEAVDWARHKSGYYVGIYNQRAPNWAECQYYIVTMEITCDPSQLVTMEYLVDDQDFRNFVKSNYPPQGHPGYNTMVWGQMFPAMYDIVSGPLTAAGAQAVIRTTSHGTSYAQQMAFVTQAARNCLSVVNVQYGPDMERTWSTHCRIQ